MNYRLLNTATAHPVINRVSWSSRRKSTPASATNGSINSGLKVCGSGYQLNKTTIKQYKKKVIRGAISHPLAIPVYGVIDTRGDKKLICGCE